MKIGSIIISIRFIKILSIYFFLFAGGLWNILGLFSEIMNSISGLVIIVIATWMAYESISKLRMQENIEQRRIANFIAFVVFIIITSWFIEYLGVRTGSIFGNYQYGDKLPPSVFQVPIAIGFAWLATLMSGFAISTFLIRTKNKLLLALITALLMTLFDFLMEPISIKLGYWSWLNNSIPLQNYIAWFLISLIYSLIGVYTNILNIKSISSIIQHGYFAQILYFLMVYLA